VYQNIFSHGVTPQVHENTGQSNGWAVCTPLQGLLRGEAGRHGKFGHFSTRRNFAAKFWEPKNALDFSVFKGGSGNGQWARQVVLRPGREGSAIPQAQLGLDALQVLLDRVLFKAHGDSDLFIGQSLSHQGNHLALAWRQDRTHVYGGWPPANKAA